MSMVQLLNVLTYPPFKPSMIIITTYFPRCRRTWPGRFTSLNFSPSRQWKLCLLMLRRIHGETLRHTCEFPEPLLSTKLIKHYMIDFSILLTKTPRAILIVGSICSQNLPVVTSLLSVDLCSHSCMFCMAMETRIWLRCILQKTCRG